MKRVDGERVRAALLSAESGTSGRIGVRVSPDNVSDALENVRSHFRRARLHEHPDSNGVLFFVAPKSRKFAVYGGQAIHERLGDAFWTQLVREMTPHFAQDDPTGGLVLGIERVGEQLRTHFPDRSAP